jgi:hypothetical protein
MSVRIRRYKTDDLAAAAHPPMEVEADSTVHREEWEIDLTKGNKQEFLRALQPFCAAARRVSGPGRQRPKAGRDRSERIRSWARENGIEVKGRGRVPADVAARYKAAVEDVTAGV